MGSFSSNNGIGSVTQHHWWDGQASGRPGTFTGGDGHLMEAQPGTGRATAITFRSVIAEDHIAEFVPFVTSYADNWSSDWSAEHVFGRSDPIYQWKSTGRSISLGFKVVAGSYREAYTNMCNVSKLTRMLYPYYADGRFSLATAVGKAPLVRLRWGNLIMNSQDAVWTAGVGSAEAEYQNGLLGVIRSLSVTPDLDEGMIEGPGPASYYPKLWNISVDFGVLHENILGWTNAYEAADHDTVDENSVVGEFGLLNRSGHFGWIPEVGAEVGIGDTAAANTGYPYGILSTGCQNQTYQTAMNENIFDEGFEIMQDYLEPTSATPDTDAGILEQEIRQQRLTNFYSRGDSRDAPGIDPNNPLSSRDRTLEPEGGRQSLDRTPVRRFTGNRQSPGSRGQGGY